jgi:hypothetical protein
MATVLETPAPRKCYYAHFYDQPGFLTRQAGSLYFISESAEVIEVEPEAITFLVVLGEMTVADGQRIADLLNGGPSGIACSRDQGKS